MAIDFNDPGQTTNQGKPIPVNTQAKYDALEAIIKQLYEYFGVPYTAESEKRLEERVRNGQTPKQIIVNTIDEYLERSKS